MGAQIDDILGDPSSLQTVDHETIYHHFLTPQPENQRMPPITREWLLDEGLYLRFAGSNTVGNICTVGTYYILHNKDVHQKLFKTLKEAWVDKDTPASYEALEKLTYLVSFSLHFGSRLGGAHEHFYIDGGHKRVLKNGSRDRHTSPSHCRSNG